MFENRKVKVKYKVQDACALYKKTFGEKSELRGLKLPIVRKICMRFNDRMKDLLIEGKELDLPCGLGTLKIIKRKVTVRFQRRIICFYNTMKNGRKTYSTFDYTYKILWSRERWGNAYKFFPIRSFKRRLYRLIVGGTGVDYMELKKNK